MNKVPYCKKHNLTMCKCKSKRIKVQKLFLFANGNIAAFDTKGRQIFDIQRRTWLEALSQFFGLDKYDFTSAKMILQGKYE